MERKWGKDVVLFTQLATFCFDFERLKAAAESTIVIELKGTWKHA